MILRPFIVNRADLVHCLRRLGAEAMMKWCAHVGFEPKKEFEVTEKESEVGTVDPSICLTITTTKTSTPSSEDTTDRLSIKAQSEKFWRVASLEKRKEADLNRIRPKWMNDNISVLREWDCPPDPKQNPPTVRPLLPWSKLWPILRQFLGEKRQTKRINLTLAVGRCAKGQPLYPLPELEGLSWVKDALVLVDRRWSLTPFWSDFENLVERLQALCGRQRMKVFQMDEGILGDCYPWDYMGSAQRLQNLSTFSTVLVVSDLGMYEDAPGGRNAWLRYGNRLRAAGIRATALVPCPQRLWTVTEKCPWEVCFWDRGIKQSHKRVQWRSDTPRNHGVSHLLRLISAAVLVGPALLRSIRHSLPASWADVGSEWHLWWHKDVVKQSQAIAVHPDKYEKYRKNFNEHPLASRAVRIIRENHCNLSPFIIDEEEMLARDLLVQGYQESDLMARVVRSFTENAYEGLRAWFGRLSKRQHIRMWQNPQLAAAYLLAFPNGPIPQGLKPGSVLFALPEDPRSYILRVVGNAWVLADNQSSGSPLLKLSSGIGYVEIEQNGMTQAFRLDDRRLPPGLDNGDKLALHTDTLTWQLERSARPPWSESMGRDPYGLFAYFRGSKFYWLNPCELPISGLDQRLEIKKGCWLDEQQYLAWSRDGVSCPDGAHTLGLDNAGVYADYSYKGIFWRMRLVLPDCFLMGSPSGEKDAQPDEKPHDVLLTKAFWLADSACTQSLWQVVMESNPSHFKGSDLPVENVSWEGVNSFLGKLPRSFGFRLPTEAEWEFACRAGENTPYAFGQTVDWKRVNFFGDFPNGSQPKGVFRERTLPVKELPPNQWGLYQMHGNVWEWCADVYSNYLSGISVDPIVLEPEDRRVIRGGCWFSRSKDIRSACRHKGGSSTSAGFRIAKDLQSKETFRRMKAVSTVNYRSGKIQQLLEHNSDIEENFPTSIQGFPYIYAHDWGEDEKGKWVALVFKGVRLALRWIPAGEFRMGSPDSEPGRNENETLHRVTFTHGFWLGETTVSQALWRAIMNENPSYFKGDDLPVESVSWNDANDFIANVNSVFPKLNLRLPTEEEWEYACRAGTQSAFSFGEQLDTEYVNFDGNTPYGSNRKGIYRRRTIGVKDLPPNQWGLYHMHGNVWEWCSEPYRLYMEGSLNTQMVTAKGPNRVMRGGSWTNFGRNIRSACRRVCEPGERSNNCGFRLARGSD